jgi:hypothetical protein
VTAGTARGLRGRDRDQPNLTALAKRIREHHKAVRSAILHAIAAGKLLIEAKAQVRKQYGHGHWENWLDRHCEMSPRTAQSYMQITKFLKSAESADLLEMCWRDMGAHDALSLRDLAIENDRDLSKAFSLNKTARIGAPRAFTVDAFLKMLRKRNRGWAGWVEAPEVEYIPPPPKPPKRYSDLTPLRQWLRGCDVCEQPWRLHPAAIPSLLRETEMAMAALTRFKQLLQSGDLRGTA